MLVKTLSKVSKLFKAGIQADMLNFNVYFYSVQSISNS
jgi:hypothetical protein